MAPPYRIVLADDHPLFRDGVKRIIKNSRDLKITGEVGDGLELLHFLRSSQTAPDLIVLDITMPKVQGLEVAKEIKQSFPGVKVLFLTMHKSKEHFLRAISLGAEGYLLKEDTHQDLIAAIKTIRAGGIYISPLMAEQMGDFAAARMSSNIQGPAVDAPPKLKKFSSCFAIGYLAWPFDLVHDYTPITGFLDDLIIMAMLMMVVLNLIPQRVADLGKPWLRKT